MHGIAPSAAEDQHFVLSSLPPTPGQKRLALGIVLGLMVALYLVTGPFGGIQLGAIHSFVAVYTTGDVRDRFDHGDTPVRSVLHSALPRHSRDREWISLYGVSDRPVCPRVSRRVGAKRRGRGLADDGASVPLLALRVPAICDRLCLVEGRGPQQTVCARGGPFSDPPECRLDGGERGRSYACCAFEAVSAQCCRASCSIEYRFVPEWPYVVGCADRCAVHVSRSSCSGFGDGRFSISS